MNNITLSVLGNKILLQVLREVKLFSKYNIKSYDNLGLCIKEASKKNNLIILFLQKLKEKDLKEMIKHSIPLIVIDKSFKEKNNFSNEFIEKLTVPFNILHLETYLLILKIYDQVRT